MKKVITYACSQVFLLVIHIYVMNNRSMKMIPDDNEIGFDFDDNEIRLLKIWPRGIIPYYIDTVSYGKSFRDRLRVFLESVNRLSGMQFVELYKPPSDNKTRWVLFINRQGLLRTDGYMTNDFTSEGVQSVVLGYESLSNGDLFEFVLAVAGIPPENNGPWRHYYVEIMNQNILDEKIHLFETVNENEWLFHDLKYDFASAGHFDFHRYSKNGLATIHPRKGIPDTQGRGKGFSYNDLLKMRMMYNFIARKKSLPAKETCQKMFKPGPEFDSYTVQADVTSSPRQKHPIYAPFSIESRGSNVSGEAGEAYYPKDNKEDQENNKPISEGFEKQPLSFKGRGNKPRWIKG